MSNPLDQAVIVIAESILAGIPGSEDRLKKILRTVGIGEMTHLLITETVGFERYRRLVA